MLDLPRPSSPGPKFSRAEDRTMMHVRLWQDGKQVRHRMMLDDDSTSNRSWSHAAIVNGRTACDDRVADHYWAVADAGYDGELCRRGCFTEPELRRADEKRAKAEAKRHDEAVKDEADREAETARARTESRNRIERYKTGETEPVIKSEPDET